MHQYDELLHERSGHAALVERATQGDEDAFAALYERHGRRVWQLAYALTGTTSDAVAVVSESFAQTFTALRAGRATNVDFATLLSRTTRHLALDARRAHGAAVPPFEAREETLVLATAFSSLPERWRSTLWLTDVDGLDGDDVASVVELDRDATAAIHFRARKGLREQYLHADVRRSTDRNCGRSVARLGAYVAGSLPAADAEKLERHLGLCDSCTDRYARLIELPSQLPTLVPALPDMLEDDVRIAWTGAVAPTSGGGLSRMGQKVLAGVAAVAAGVGVFGAALMSVSGSGNDDDEAVAPIAPIVTELATPRPPDMDLTIDLDPDRSSDRPSSPDAESDGVVGASARNGADDAVTADLDTDGPPATPIRGDGDGGDPTPPTVPDAPAPEPTDSEPAVSVGVDVGDIPIAVEVGEDPGVTVGPISVGSEPAPGTATVAVGGPLAPLAPVVEPVDEAIGGLLGG